MRRQSKNKTTNRHPEKFITAKFKSIKKAPAVARIIGQTNGLPVLTVDFVNKPLWRVLQDVSGKTGYMFTSRRIDLGADITLSGKYNLAVLLNKLFAKDTVRINPQTKEVNIYGK